VKRRTFIAGLGSAAVWPVVARIARAQTYPKRPVRLIVGVAAGGGSDTVARLIAQWLSERLNQQFVIENRPGAGSNLATEAVVNAPPDGYTLLLAEPANAINATLYQRLNFNFIRDIVPVASIVRVANVMLVHPTFPAKTVPELIAYAKTHPGTITVGSPSGGSPTHMSAELFKFMAGVNMVHVPYRSNANSMTDLLGGQIQVVFATTAAAIGYLRAGTLRALAVTTATRSEMLPANPAMGEFLPGYEASTWWGVGAPRATPSEIVNLLNREINVGLADAGVKTRLGDLGGTVLPGSPADFRRFIVDETEKWGKVVKFAGITAE
jgi:tripartite-type tricarboxylate transporter receptor subunit TctC